MEFVRRNHGTGHSYHLDGVKLPGVTAIINDGMPKQLTDWAARVTADAAINSWDELAAMSISQRIRWLEGAPRRELGAAAKRGTEIHALVFGIIAGEPVEVPDEHAGAVAAATRLMDVLQMVPVLREVPVFHVEHRWGGTADLVADIHGTRWLLDWKTGRNVFDSTAVQLAAYNHATHYLDGDQIREWVPAQRCGVVHITPDDAQLYPTEAGDDVYTTFRYAYMVADWTARARNAWKAGDPWPIHPSLHPAA